MWRVLPLTLEQAFLVVERRTTEEPKLHMALSG
jgi:hypothetical protein